MASSGLLLLIVAVAAFTSSEAFWRMSCGLIQTGRLDPIVSPGVVASHVHKIAGASNINVSSTYASLQKSSCTSCSIQADKSAYWTPSLWYRNPNGTFQPVANDGMAVYYLGRGNNKSLQPFPPGLRMLSGNALARSYDNVTRTYTNRRPIADRVSFACLDASPLPETPGMVRTKCKYGLRAQIQFQSCWDGKNLYLPDNSHVAYFSDIDNGICPPTHPIPFIHLFYEVMYAMDSVDTSNGGRFVFSQGDTTGYGFHGDFMNGWDAPTLKAAINQCAFDNAGNGNVDACAPLRVTNNNAFSSLCPPQPDIVLEPIRGLLPKLPGCIKVTSGPAPATIADIVCPAGTKPPPLAQLGMPIVAPDGWVYLGCANESTKGRALASASVANDTMTATVCRAFCRAKGFSLAGAEYGRECFCGNSFADGSSLNQTGCTFRCAGDANEVCGGGNRLSIWKAPSKTPSGRRMGRL